MPHEIGGIAEKLGNKYEGRWVAKQLLRLLDEKIVSVTVEPLSDMENGIDLIVVENEGTKLLQQCKSRNQSKNSWTPYTLNKNGVLDYLKSALLKEQNSKYWLVSPLFSNNLVDLCDWARNSSGNAQDYYQYQVKKSKTMKNCFHSICKYMELDPNVDKELDTVFSFLKRTHFVTYPDDINELKNLYDLAGFLLSGNPVTAIAVLLTYVEQGNYRKPIYADALWKYLREEHSIYRRALLYDGRLAPAIESLNAQFIDSISFYLIKNQLISREEVSQILENVNECKDVVVCSSGGGGKSVVLYELALQLDKNKIPFLALSLDQRVPESSAKIYGESIGLVGSPVDCLLGNASDRKCVLILDQLDSIRWTSKHSSESMIVCREMLQQVRGARQVGKDISVVFACRSYDLENDSEIKRVLNFNTNETFTKVEVHGLTDDIVSKIVGSAYSGLTNKQKKILTSPQNLRLWTCLQAAEYLIDFENPVQLMQRFWEYARSKAVDYHNVSVNDFNRLLEKVIDYLEGSRRYFAPKRVVSEYPHAAEALLSLNVVEASNGRIRFVHQQYYDFLVAENLMLSLDKNPKYIVDWLGEFSNQSLFRREHLRIVLTILATEMENDLLVVSRILLDSNSVRFNLKHLVLEIFGQLMEVSDGIGNYIMAQETESNWGEHIREVVYFGHSPWVKYLNQNGYFAKGLNSGDDSLVLKLLGLLHSVVDTLPNIVSSILAQFEDDSNEWSNRILNTICRNPNYDSPLMFQQRVRLARNGYINENISWKKYFTKHPFRALEYLNLIVSTWKYDTENNLIVDNEIQIYDSKDFSSLINVIESYPSYSWHVLVKHLIRLTLGIVKKNDSRIVVWNNDGLSSKSNANIQNFLSLVRHAGLIVAKANPIQILEKLDSHLANDSIVLSRVLLEASAELDAKCSDEVIKWLLHNRTLFQIGSGISEPEWVLAARVLQKHSSSCTIELFRDLEEAVYYHHDQREKELAKFYLKSWKDGWFDFFWGKCQFFLLPALDESRISEKTKYLICELKRKFRNYDEARFLTRHSLGGGQVESTLEPNLDKISDKAWLQIVRNDEAINSSKRNWIPYSDGVILDSSISQFANSLRKLTYRFPNRFARLALKFPVDTDSAYISAVLDACQLSEPKEEHIPNQEREAWEPVSIKILEQLLRKHSTADDAITAMSFVYLMDSRASEDWSEDSLDRLIRYSIEHPDPAANELHLHCNLSADEASIDVLITNSLNCVRGATGNALARLLWEKKEIFDSIQPAIESLIRDPHPVVRIASLRIIHATINIDREKAFQWLLIACDGDLRITASSVGLIIADCCINNHHEEIRLLLIKMINSTDEEVQRIAAKRLASYWIVRDFFEAELFENINCATSIRKGFAQAGLHYLDKPEYLEKCIRLLLIFMNDSDKAVRGELRSMFIENSNISSEAYKQFLKCYVESLAFLDNPAHFLFDLEKFTGSILPFAEVIITMAEKIAHEVKLDREYVFSKGYQINIITTILLKLYQESYAENNKHIQNKCLNCWDKFLECRIGRVREITKLIDES